MASSSSAPAPAVSASMDLRVTEAARAAAARDLGDGQELRIAFAGGCGAMGFRLSASRRRFDGDLHLDLEGLAVALDPKAVRELPGATLDYDEDEGFLLDHPAWGLSC